MSKQAPDIDKGINCNNNNKPKGVQVTHRSKNNQITNAQIERSQSYTGAAYSGNENEYETEPVFESVN